jgi:GNAT superfamily N-acetyltransferase
MHIASFTPAQVNEAAAMFVASFTRLRDAVPAVPDTFGSPETVATRLDEMQGVAAVDADGRLLGYLTSWFPIERFRDTTRTGAYVPEWGHGAVAAAPAAVHHALYRAASSAWSAAGCEVHAVTVLAGDDRTRDRWWWSGFGMGPVDAIRPTTPLGAPAVPDVTVRAATVTDRGSLATLDLEHRRAYTLPPVFMPLRPADDEAGWAAFLSQARGSVWLAEDGAGVPIGFLRFDREFGGCDLVASDDGVFISGAYVRAPHRGRGIATALLDAGLAHHAAAGRAYCAVDFEAFNPEAATFWLRWFAPVAHSLLRIPEAPAAG